MVFHGKGAPEKRMRVTGFWQSWLLPLILVLTLVGVSRGLGAEAAAPEPAVGSTPTAPAPPAPYEPPAALRPHPRRRPYRPHAPRFPHRRGQNGARQGPQKGIIHEAAVFLAALGHAAPIPAPGPGIRRGAPEDFLPPPGFFPHGDQTRNQLWPERGGGCHPED